MSKVRACFHVIFVAAALLAACPLCSAGEGGEVKFVMHRVGSFRSEACGVGDFNKDGKLDIVAGPNLYLAPDWKPVKIRELAGSVDEAGKGYQHDFANLPIDVDGDGRLDVVSVMWHEKKSVWYKNPGEFTQLWAESLIEENGNFECAHFVDLKGKGSPSAIVPHVGRTVWYEPTPGDAGGRFFKIHVVAEKKHDYGVGAGDIDGDGRPDIVRPGAWYQAPAQPGKEWIEHPLALGNMEPGKSEHTPEILVCDVNKHGRNDIITGSAHRYGIFWYEQLREGGKISWKQHVIDSTWTQAHSLTLGDIDDDGTPDLVTAKRFMAHNGHDPDETAPLGVYWYKLTAGPKPAWTKHTISYNEGIGSGINHCLVDLDGDGDLDVVVTGKYGGPVWFENKRK